MPLRPTRFALAAGFTLLEMLVALAVFAVIGVMSAQLVRQMADISERTRLREERLVDMQRAMDLLRRDVQQLAHRPVRDQLGDGGDALRIDLGGSIEFTRRGWGNPLAAPRSELQRVGYALEQGDLYRVFWPVLDRANDSEPVRQLLLQDLASLEVAAIDAKGEEYGYWPLAEESDAELAAIAVRLVIERLGEIERIWTVPLTPAPEADAEEDSIFDDDDDEDARTRGEPDAEDTPADADRPV